MTKIALVTGASSGIGQAIAISLAKEKLQILIVCRTIESGNKTLQTIKNECQNAQIELFIADLSSQKDILKLIDAIQKRYAYIDILIHCAGVLNHKRILTEEGIEATFAVNHMAPFILTTHLLPLLKKAKQARIIVITSRAEEMGKIDFADLHGLKKYSAIKSYSQSKLANILFTYELASRLANTSITVNCVHPGLVKSNLGRSLPFYLQWFLMLIQPFMKSAKQAAIPILDLALDDKHSLTTGKYFSGFSLAKSSQQSHDKELANKLWQVSKEI